VWYHLLRHDMFRAFHAAVAFLVKFLIAYNRGFGMMSNNSFIFRNAKITPAGNRRFL